MSFFRSSIILRLTPFIAAILLSFGCNSPRSAERGPPPPPQIPLTAESEYLDGTLLVQADFGPFQLQRPDGTSQSEAAPQASRPNRGDRPDRSGGGGRRPPGDGASPSGGDGRQRSGGADGGPSAMRGPLRQSLAITLHNTSDQPVHLRVAEVKSLLGNIVLDPETFTLEPGATQALAPMRAGIRENVSEFHVTLRIRTADANETQTLVLRPIAPQTPRPGIFRPPLTLRRHPTSAP